MSTSDIFDIASHHFNFLQQSAELRRRKYSALFGISIEVKSQVWKLIVDELDNYAEPKHLLWALFFLKNYCTENTNSSIWNCDEKTFRKWTWHVVVSISHLKIINWSDRVTSDMSLVSNTYCSVDGTDCRIAEPTPFSFKWYSQKFKGPGVRYEIGISHHDGNILWLHGPFPCGLWPAIKMFKEKMSDPLMDNEKVVADNGYKHHQYVTPANVSDREKAAHALLRARHKTFNSRLKNFNILRDAFRHRLQLHEHAFYAVAKLSTLMVRNGSPLFFV